MKRLIIISAAGLIALIIILRIIATRRIEENIVETGLNRVKVAEIRERRIEQVLEYPGDIKGIKEALVFSDVPGILREKVKKPGQTVKKDDIIAMIDRYEVALQYSMSPVKSPIYGRVLDIYKDIGSRVGPSEPLAKVGDMSRVEVIVYVSERQASNVAVGQKAFVRVDAYPEKKFPGKVSEVSEALDPDTRKASIKIVVPNPEYLLKSGMVADVVIVVRSLVSSRAVPVSAVVERNGRSGVFLVDEDNKAIWVEIKIVLKGKDYFAVDAKLGPGDRVVTDGNYGLIPDRTVEIVE